MSNPTPSQVAASDPLRDITRREGRILVVTCIIALMIVLGGFVPEEIQALGIKLTAANKKALVFLVGVGCVYVLLSYLLCVASDFASWHLERRASHKHWHEQRANTSQEQSDLYAQVEFTMHGRTLTVVNHILRLHSRALFLVHVLIPVALSLLAIWICFRYIVP